MESTTSSTTNRAQIITVTSLRDAFATVPDPRREASILYPLPAILALSVAAILCGHLAVLAIAEWGADQPSDLLVQLGFLDGHTPCQSTLHRLFRQLDVHALTRALRLAFSRDEVRERGEQGVAIDGKAHRGRRQFEERPGVVHVLSAFCHEQNLILAQEPISHGTDKDEAELTVAPTLIEHVDWRGRVLTGDALYCQRALCAQVCAAGGDYLLLVKGNQRRLFEQLLRTFAADGRPLLDRREARTVDQGHGRTADTRHLVVTADPLALPDWPHVAQVFQLERTWMAKGKPHRQVRYGITSIPREPGTPERLLELRRGHWRIENRGHRAKDVNLGEDASLIHADHGPDIVAVLRSIALNVLRDAGCAQIATSIRYFARHADEAIALVLAPSPARA